MQFGARRLVLLGLAGLLAGTAFGFWQGRRASSSSDVRTGISPTYLDEVVPGLCIMESQLGQNQRSEAYNTFWNTVHLPAHALAAELTARDRVAAGSFQRAKLAVETDMTTMAPTLGASVKAFETAARRAVAEAGRPEPKACT